MTDSLPPKEFMCTCGHHRLYHTSWGDCFVVGCGCKRYVDGPAAYELGEHPSQRHRMTEKEPLEPDNDKLTIEALKLVVKELTGKIQLLVEFLDEKGLLEDHCFTFPDGDVYKTKDVEPPKTS